MANRFVVWLSAGVLAAGVSMGAIAGAGLAAADDGAADGGGASPSADSSDSGGTQTDSQSDRGAESDGPADVDKDPADEAGDDEPQAEPVDEDEPIDEEDASEEEEEVDEPSDTEDTTDERSLPLDNSPENRAVTNVRPNDDQAEATGPAPVTRESEPVVPVVEEVEPAPPPPVTADVTPVAVDVDGVVPTSEEPELSTARLMMSAVEVEEAAPAKPTLLNVIGTLAWSVFDFVNALFEGPPVVPAGSNVTVGRSKLNIECGDGYTAAADWYFPSQVEAPTKLIYLQHGGFARAGLYNGTAAELAERNNAIVVAPSITSNFFACDGCALGGNPMHAAVAKLFLDDRAALLANAQAAGFSGSELPQRFVIAGHSAGGQLAAASAGHYARFAPASQLHNLAGVLLLDTSSVGGAIERGVRRIPDDIPVYVISATPGQMNAYGGADRVLAELRPNQFVGVQLVGGVHADAWQTTNALAELIVGLATGYPAPENIEAVHVLAQGWINDWYTPQDADTGFYGDPGSVIDIPTPAGTAEAYVLPAPQRQLTVIDLFLKAIFESTALLTALQTCAVDPEAGYAASQSRCAS